MLATVAACVSSGPLFHYVVVRLDVPDGVWAAQLIHAAGESSRLVPHLPPDTRAVALGVSGEPELLALEARLHAADLAHTAIREPDRQDQLMAIGLAPAPKTSRLREVMSTFRLIP